MDLTVLTIISALNLVLTVVLLTVIFARKNDNRGNVKDGETIMLLNRLHGSLESYRAGLSHEMQMSRQTETERLELIRRQMVELDARVNNTLAQIRLNLDAKVNELRVSNEKSLEQMRNIVDEKLSANLEQRLAKNFSVISERLEAVYKGLGEMQTLASGVSDLKKVLTNVKTRGTWGEVALDSMLSQILAPEQYARSVKLSKTDGEDRMVDFAVVMPGKDNEKVLLPIDSKFPLEDYRRLVEASETGDANAVDIAVKSLNARIKDEAASIRDYYIRPPKTTDFAIMYLPIEGLYAEVIRRTGLADELQNKYRVIVAGPTTLAALLNSLQMGFKTLAIEKHSKEIQKLFGAFKGQFIRFTDLLAKTQKQISMVSRSIDETSSRANKIREKLSSVETITGVEADELIGIESGFETDATENDGYDASL